MFVVSTVGNVWTTAHEQIEEILNVVSAVTTVFKRVYLNGRSEGACLAENRCRFCTLVCFRSRDKNVGRSGRILAGEHIALTSRF